MITFKHFKAVMSMLLVIFMICSTITTFALEDTSRHWAAKSIETLVNKGIVVGDENGRINPDTPITRAEFVTIINKAFGFTTESGENFPDVMSGKWYFSQFAKAKLEGFINGDEHGNANPDAYITRAEVAVIFTNILNLKSDKDASTFTDNSAIPSWSLASIIAMQEKKLINGYPDGSVRADSNLTRAEGFIILVNIIESGLAEQTEKEISDSNLTALAPALVLEDGISRGRRTPTTTSPITDEWDRYMPDKNMTEEERSDIIEYLDLAIFPLMIQHGLDPKDFNWNANYDDDGLTNYQEYTYGTNPFDADTDNDGLTDYEEIFIYGTNSLNPDTDGDVLTDYEEVVIYGTDPLKSDTDNDGLLDRLEIKYGMNPNKPDTLGDGILDGDRIFTVNETSKDWENGDPVKPIIEIQLRGRDIESLSIDKVLETDVFLGPGVPGYLGNAFDFNVDGNFTTATLTFEFDGSLVRDQDFLPTIYYWDEDEQLLEEVPNQTINGNFVSANITHFSSYILLNKKDFDWVWQTEIKPPNYTFKHIDLAIVIDNSGSMDNDDSQKNDPNRLRHVVAKELIDKLGIDDRVAIVNFSNSAVLQMPFTNNKEDAKNAVDSFINGGSTALYDAINVANNQFALNSSNSVNKIMVVLTDGMDNNSIISLSSVIQEAFFNNVKIYAVGLGTQIDIFALNSLVNSTGGQYYHATFADDLLSIFDKIAEEDIQIDMDNDGLPDYFEKLINDGKLVLGNGRALWDYPGAVKLSWDDPNNKDSDGDGLMDGEEIEVRFKENPDGTYKVWVYVNSNPCLADTDSDGWNDKEDPTPLVKGLRDGVVGALKIFSTTSEDTSFFVRTGGHAWVVYTSFIKDDVELFGRYMENFPTNYNGIQSAMTSVGNNYPAQWNTILFEISTYKSIGTWAGWLEDSLKGTWINVEFISNSISVYSDTFSLERTVAEKDLIKLSELTESKNKWSVLVNCSAFAVDVWNGMFNDNLSARGVFFRTPATLIKEMQKRTGSKHNDSFKADLPQYMLR